MPDKAWRLRVEGEPAPKGSPSIMRTRGGTPFVREGERQRVHEQAIREAAALSPPPMAVGGTAVSLDIEFVMSAPKWVAGRRKPNRNRPGFEPRHTRKPDIDKLVRTVLDGLTGYVFGDDSMVVHVVATKRYALPVEAPHTAIDARFLAPEEER